MRNVVTAAALAAIVAIWPGAISANDHGHNHANHSQAQSDHGHHHHHTAPHGGTMVALGDEAAHLELALNPATGHLTGYVLDGEGEKSIRIKQPTITLQAYAGDLKSTPTIELKAVANPLTGEKTGNTSQFEATSPALKSAKRFYVHLKAITIKGVEFKNVTSAFPEGNH